MNTATLTDHARYVRATFEHLDRIKAERPIAAMWWDAMNDATDQSPMSQKSFLENHDYLYLLQASFTDDQITGLWAPGVREVDTSHATYATFDGSRRDYAGVIHIAHSDETWIGFDKDMNTLIVYTTE